MEKTKVTGAKQVYYPRKAKLKRPTRNKVKMNALLKLQTENMLGVDVVNVAIMVMYHHKRVSVCRADMPM